MKDKNFDISRRNVIKTIAATSALGVTGTSLEASTSRDDGKMGDKSKYYSMLVDLRKCIGCQSCTASCKIENHAPTAQFRTFVKDIEVGVYPDTKRSFLPTLCNHCDKPSCTPVCPTGATFKRSDGIVIVDSDTCIGCGACVNACPYNARFINAETKVADKCTFCAHRTKEGLIPSCVENCVGGARIFGDISDKNSAISKLIKENRVDVLKSETGNKPQVYYIGLTKNITDESSKSPNLWSEGMEEVFDKEMAYKSVRD